MPTPQAELVRERRGLDRHRDAWEALAQASADPNVFLEPFNVLAAVDAFGWRESLRFVFVRDGKELIGFFPLELKMRFRGLPLRHLAAWEHPHLFLSMPLVHASRGVDAWRGLLRWAAAGGGRLVELPAVVGGSATRRHLDAALAAEGGTVAVVSAFARALLAPTAANAEAYSARASSASARKEWRRQRRRLGELGRLELRRLAPGDPVEAWVEPFLALEAGGWKGEGGTALASDPRDAAYFRAVCGAAHARGRLHMLGLFLDGAAVALQCNLLAPGGDFALKVAYDERFARFSPGALLELDNIADMLGRDDFVWLDSCAGGSHPLMPRLWSERRVIEHLLVAPGRAAGRAVVALYPWLRRVRRAARVPAPGGKGRGAAQ